MDFPRVLHRVGWWVLASDRAASEPCAGLLEEQDLGSATLIHAAPPYNAAVLGSDGGGQPKVHAGKTREPQTDDTGLG